METLKHSEDDSGRVDNVLRDDGKEGAKGQYCPWKGQRCLQVSPFSSSSTSATLPMPQLALGTSPEGEAQDFLIAVSTKLLISLCKDQAHQACTILSEAGDSPSQERKRRWLISLPCIQLEGELFVLRRRAERVLCHCAWSRAKKEEGQCPEKGGSLWESGGFRKEGRRESVLSRDRAQHVPVKWTERTAMLHRGDPGNTLLRVP